MNVTEIQNKPANHPFIRNNVNNQSIPNHRKNDSINIVHWNCNSIKSKIEFLKLFIKKNHPHIISLNELKCNNIEMNMLFNDLIEYNCYYKCRVNNKGGGVALLVKKNLQHVECSDFDFLNLEIICIKLFLENKEVLIFSYYNPPPTLICENFINLIEEKGKDYLICGDLNARSTAIGCTANNNNGKVLDDILINNKVILINPEYSPTFHIPGRSYNEMLDLMIGTSFFANNLSKFEVLKESVLDSDHSPIRATFKITSIKSKKILSEQTQMNLLNYSKADWNKFKNFLNNYSLDIQNASIEVYHDRIVSMLVNAADHSIEKLKVNMDCGASSCLPSYILDLIKLRNKQKRLWNSCNSSENKNKYYDLKNLVRDEISAFKSNKWQVFMDKLETNPVSSKPFWQRINKLRCSKSSNFIPNITFENTTYSSNEEKANIFAKRLSKTFSDESSPNFDLNFKNIVDNYIITKEFHNEYLDKSTVAFNLEELNTVIKNLNNKSSADQVNLSNRLIKNLPFSTRLILLNFYNRCLVENSIPKEWKSAVITMIPKGSKNKQDIANYRPISITPYLAKLFEKLIALRLVNFIKDKNLLSDRQSGFRKYRQTKDNIFYLVQKATESFNRKKKMFCIFFDIAGAFDKVYHNGLIYKLIKLKIPFYIINFLIEFLKDRKFCVKIGSFSTTEMQIETGVPQGAVLSPILFSLYINDIPLNNKKNETGSVLFADDLAYFNIYKSFSPKIVDHINNHLKNLEVWLNKWRLKMAAHKCNYIVFSKHEMEKNVFKIRLYDTMIKIEESPKFLGIRFDRRLTFQNQIDYIKSVCVDRINILKIIRHKSWHLSTTTLTRIYCVLIRSIMEYSALLLPVIKKSAFNSLQLIQNKCMRLILKVTLLDGIPNDRLHKMTKLEPLDKRFDELASRYVSNAIKTENPLIKQLITEFKSFNGGRNLKIKTLLSDKDQLLDESVM